jgi:hypothetical protein
MTDKELLELAAKAADIPFNALPHSKSAWTKWNPLTDDGDALRLAVKLSLDIYVDSNLTEVIYLDATTEAHLSDPYAATRRAITRAAAAIGKAVL